MSTNIRITLPWNRRQCLVVSIPLSLILLFYWFSVNYLNVNHDWKLLILLRALVVLTNVRRNIGSHFPSKKMVVCVKDCKNYAERGECLSNEAKGQIQSTMFCLPQNWWGETFPKLNSLWGQILVEVFKSFFPRILLVLSCRQPSNVLGFSDSKFYKFRNCFTGSVTSLLPNGFLLTAWWQWVNCQCRKVRIERNQI